MFEMLLNCFGVSLLSDGPFIDSVSSFFTAYDLQAGAIYHTSTTVYEPQENGQIVAGMLCVKIGDAILTISWGIH